MKRLLLATALVALLGGTTAPMAASDASAVKRTLCHRTASAKKPYVKITVSTKAALQGHLKRHAADIYPVPAGGCPKVALTPTQGGTVLTATLAGSNEVPPADPDGSGTATFRMISGAAVVCFTITVEDITLPATGAHIHVGAAGVNGGIVVALNAPDAAGSASGCVNSSRSLVAAILANPSGYYANVHTTDYPNGAVRGQLAAA
jgi:hypothetical protein